MKRLLMGLAALPFVAGVAVAAQPLTPQQMDRVTAGQFSAQSTADAQGLAPTGGTVLTTTSTLAEVTPYATIGTVTVYESLAAASSSSVAE